MEIPSFLSPRDYPHINKERMIITTSNKRRRFEQSRQTSARSPINRDKAVKRDRIDNCERTDQFRDSPFSFLLSRSSLRNERGGLARNEATEGASSPGIRNTNAGNAAKCRSNGDVRRQYLGRDVGATLSSREPRDVSTAT